LIAAGALVDARTVKGETPLMSAAFSGSRRLVATLIEAGADVNATNENGQTPLTRAVVQRYTEIVKTLLAAKADPKVTAGGWSVFHHLVGLDSRRTAEDHAITDLLVAAGANVEAVDESGRTPLMAAARLGNEVMLKALLDAKANPNASDKEGWTALHHAVDVEADRDSIVEVLAARGADVNAKLSNGISVLQLATSRGNEKVVAVLLKRKADPNAKDSAGWTPLMQAADEGHLGIARQLLASGANPNLAGDQGWTALHLTANAPDKPEHDYGDVAGLLVAKGANVAARNGYGFTPLMVAARNGKPKVAAALIKAKAGINLVNENHSALDFAEMWGHAEVALALRNAGAKSGLQQAQYPEAPAARPGVVTCNTRCINGDCYRTYANGRKVHFQAEQRYNPSSGQWEWDSGGC